MDDPTSRPHIQLRDFRIRSPFPLPKLLHSPSRLALKLSVNGVDEEVLTARGDIDDGTWEADGDVKICEDQLLLATILFCIQDSTKELGSVTVSYSRLLAHAEAQSKECYEFTVDGSTFSFLIRVTCSIKTTVQPPREQLICTESVSSSKKSKTDTSCSSSNRALIPETSSIPSIADLEHYYGQAASLSVECKPRTLNTIGCAYRMMYDTTYEMDHLEKAISILGEALQNASSDPRLPEYIDDLAVCLLRRFQRTGNHDDIEDAISKSHRAVHTAETDDPNRHRYISHRANALLERFMCLGKLEDLQKSISFMTTAVSLVPDGYPGKPQYLRDLGNGFKARFGCLGHVEDLKTAFVYNQKAVDLAPDDHPDKPSCFNSLGNAFATQFGQFGRVEDLEIAIRYTQNAVDLTLDGYPDKSNYLNNLGNAFKTQFDRSGRIEDLGTAITHSQKAVDMTPDGHPYKPRYLGSLGIAFAARFGRLGHVEDLEIAIAYNQQAVNLMSDAHPERPRYLDSLGIAFATRFDRLGHVEDLEIAIVHKQKAVDLTPDGHPHKPDRLKSLGNSFETRFDRSDCVKDLENAIMHKQKAVTLIPSVHPERPRHLGSLGNSFEKRFDRLGLVEDLEIAIAHKQKAVDLTPDSHQIKPRYLNNLGTAFETKFDQLGCVEDLEIAIAHKQHAVDLTPDGHPDKPAYLHNLGIALETQFNQLGCVEDLERAITHKQNAINLTPDGHPKKSARLNSLGEAFKTRFHQLGRIEDLELAIVHTQKAINLTPDGHPNKAGRLNSLGSAFETRFDRLGHVKDLDIAIMHKQKAVDLMPDTHPARPKFLGSLGVAFKMRFHQSGHVEDLEIAIIHEQKAVDLIPDGHPDKPYHLDSLGDAFDTRFDRLGHVEDLEIAIVHKQKAVDLTPDGHPKKAGRLLMLGKAFLFCFKLPGRRDDVYMALMQFSMAASLPTASSRIRLYAARYWADISKILQTFEASTEFYLEPHHVAIDLLPRVAWLGIPMSAQHALLEEVGGTVREAVAAAARMEEYELAVEWAEAGRSIAWQNLLNLRTPVSELRRAHNDLADRLEAISRQLDMSVRESDGRMNGATDGLEEVSRSHVQLALDWDSTVADIRSKHGFESFLKPKSFNELGRVVRDGPIVILNITEDGCDALVLIPEDSGGVYVSSVPLPDFSSIKGEALLKELKQLLQSRNLLERNARSKMKRRPPGNKGKLNFANILCSLWKDVVKPIIEALAYQPRSTDLPHIWWCATGALAFLPIHAAGIYDTDEPGNKLSDYVVSSYTPTLSALLDASTPSHDGFKLLAIAQANAPGQPSIPQTEVEVKKIETLAKSINLTTMKKEDATIENVWHGMETSSWVHLACHGQQNIKEPMKSGLLLHDGTLELQRLIEKPLPRADFAFLSACQTATGDESMAEESVHLAAGMLFAGYKGVIATMWSIKDEVGPRVAEDVYREMLKDGKPNRKAAAHALHNAVKRLREDPKVDMLHWVPFIHIGL